MHARFYNEAIFRLRLRPRTPLLIKSGDSGDVGLDPTLRDMNFVRTRRPDRPSDEVYIPGSSLRGVVRSHAERLLRSLSNNAACDAVHPTEKKASPGLKPSCAGGVADPNGVEAYQKSCRACRLFGNTMLAGRLRVADFYLAEDATPAFETRHGVAIDRVTGAVAQGPFEMEIMTAGAFDGSITVRNYTLAQFGLLAAAILDIGDGLVPLGYAKSRGLGRLSIEFPKLLVRTLRNPGSRIQGVGALCDDETRRRYELPGADRDQMQVQAAPERRGGFWLLATQGETARAWLEQGAGRWTEELSP